MSFYCLIVHLVVCHKKGFSVCCATDVIKTSLFGPLTVKSAVKCFNSHIFSSLCTVCGSSDKAGWTHIALTKIPFKRENGIECHSITADGKHGNTLTQKAFTLTYTKGQKSIFLSFPIIYVQYCSILSFKRSLAKSSHLFDFIPFHHLSGPKSQCIFKWVLNVE